MTDTANRSPGRVPARTPNRGELSFAAIVIGTLVVTWCVFFSRTHGFYAAPTRSQSSPHPTAAPGPVERVDADQVAQRTQVTGATTQSPPGVVLVDVDDGSGPLAGVSAVAVIISGREIEPSDGGPLGWTDVRGTVRLAWPGVDVGSRGIWLEKEGYASQAVFAPVAGAAYRVSMHREGRFRVSVVDGAGAPVSGLELRLSGSALPATMAVNDQAEGQSGVSALRQIVLRGTTSAAGVLEWRGLSQARYAAEVGDNSTWVEVQRSGDWSADLEVGGVHEVKVVVGRVYAAIVRITGDEMISHSWQRISPTTVVAADTLIQLRARVRGKHRGDNNMISVCAERDARSPVHVLPVRLQCSFRRKGVLEFVIEHSALDELHEHQIDVGGYPDVVAHPTITLTIVDRSGRPLEGSLFAQAENPRRRLAITHGMPRPLPQGTYRLTSLDRELARALRTLEPLQVETDGQVFERAVQERFRRSRILVLGQDRCVPRHWALRVEAQNGDVVKEHFVEASDGSPVALTLREAPGTRIRVRVFGYEDHVISLDDYGNIGDDPIVVNLMPTGG